MAKLCTAVERNSTSPDSSRRALRCAFTPSHMLRTEDPPSLETLRLLSCQ